MRSNSWNGMSGHSGSGIVLDASKISYAPNDMFALTRTHLAHCELGGLGG